MQKSLRLVLQMHRAASNKSVRAGRMTTTDDGGTSATNDSDDGKRNSGQKAKLKCIINFFESLDNRLPDLLKNHIKI